MIEYRFRIVPWNDMLYHLASSCHRHIFLPFLLRQETAAYWKKMRTVEHQNNQRTPEALQVDQGDDYSPSTTGWMSYRHGQLPLSGAPWQSRRVPSPMVATDPTLWVQSFTKFVLSLIRARNKGTPANIIMCSVAGRIRCRRERQCLERQASHGLKTGCESERESSSR